MIHLNGNSTDMIVSVFRRQLWNMGKAQIAPKAKYYQIVQIQWRIQNKAKSPVVRCGGSGLIWVQQIIA
jgi:hypothetical protein